MSTVQLVRLERAIEEAIGNHPQYREALAQDDWPPRGFELVLPMNDPLAAERVFHELAADGTIKMPLQETFWASRFGVLVDRFGIPWTVNCERVAPAAT